MLKVFQLDNFNCRTWWRHTHTHTPHHCTHSSVTECWIEERKRVWTRLKEHNRRERSREWWREKEGIKETPNRGKRRTQEKNQRYQKGRTFNKGQLNEERRTQGLLQERDKISQTNRLLGNTWALRTWRTGESEVRKEGEEESERKSGWRGRGGRGLFNKDSVSFTPGSSYKHLQSQLYSPNKKKKKKYSSISFSIFLNIAAVIAASGALQQ